MNFLTIQEDVGSLINQTDVTTGEFVPGYITLNELKKFINRAYFDVYLWYAKQNPENFSQDTWVDLIADRSIYSIEGDASDIMYINWIGIKYTAEEEEYIRMTQRRQREVIETGYERFHEGAPIYWRTMRDDEDAGTTKMAIEIRPVPEAGVVRGLQMNYVERPAQLADDTDEMPNLPIELQEAVTYGAAMRCMIKMKESQMIGMFRDMYQEAIGSFQLKDQSGTSDYTHNVRFGRSNVARFYKRR